MKCGSRSARFVHNTHMDMACKNVCERYRAIKDRRSSCTSKDTKGVRCVASSVSGMGLDALAVKGRWGQNLIIEKKKKDKKKPIREQELTILIMT